MRRTPFAAIACAATLWSLSAHAVAIYRQELLDALRSQPNIDRGAALFEPCTACHGPGGAGTLDGGVPRIAGQHASVLMKQLVDFRHGQRWDFRMEHFADDHHLSNPQAIADVAAYIQQLPISGAPGVGSGEFAEHGSSIYLSRCSSCHGLAAQGAAKTLVPQLAGQHYDYLLRQIYNAVDGRRPNLPVRHIRLLARMQYEDIIGLADYLSRMPAVEDSARVAQPEMDSARK